MEVGDIIKINGRFGFLMNPKLKVLEIKGTLAKVISVDRVGDNEGLLSHMNESWHCIESLESRHIKPPADINIISERIKERSK